MNNIPEDIFMLIAAQLCGEELTELEKERLNNWREASEEHQKEYHYYEEIFERKARLRLFDQIHRPEEIVSGLFRQKRMSRKRLILFMAYAAVLVPVLFLSVWLVFHKPAEKDIASFPVAVVEDIAPGKQKARLQLENGETVSLSDSSMTIKTHQNITIENGGVLQYAAKTEKEQVKAVYHTLVVEKGGEFQLILPDGTKVWLNSDSELKYPNIFNEDTRKVYLKGEAYFEVTHAQQHPFIVHAGECAIRVLGTAFNISSYEEEKEIVTTLVNGRVAYTAGGQQGELLPGEQCVYGKEAKKIEIQKVNVNRFISWKNGLFVFDHISMEELAKQISRWYDVEVVFPDEKARKISFTGAMERYRPVSYLIQVLNETNTVDCRLEANMLVFRSK